MKFLSLRPPARLIDSSSQKGSKNLLAFLSHKFLSDRVAVGGWVFGCQNDDNEERRGCTMGERRKYDFLLRPRRERWNRYVIISFSNCYWLVGLSVGRSVGRDTVTLLGGGRHE